MIPKMSPSERLSQLEYLYSDLAETNHLKWCLKRLRQLTTALEEISAPEELSENISLDQDRYCSWALNWRKETKKQAEKVLEEE